MKQPFLYLVLGTLCVANTVGAAQYADTDSRFTGQDNYSERGFSRSEDGRGENRRDLLNRLQNVNIRIDNGTVYLTGTIDERDHKELKQRLQQLLAGSRNVNDQLKIQRKNNSDNRFWGDSSQPNRDGNPDSEIESSIQGILEPGLISKGYDRVNFQVSRGRVSLNGSVDKASDKRAIMEKVAAIEGLTAIDNQIKAPAEQSNMVNDDEIIVNIQKALKGGLLSSGYENISFDVSRGKINLKGAVAKESDIRSILQKVAAIEGVSAIESRLQIRPDSNQGERASSASNNGDIDGQIQTKLQDALKAGLISKGYDGVSFQVTRGKVSLRGNVDKASDIRALMEKVAAIDGITVIENNVRAPADQANAVSEDEIIANLQKALKGGMLSRGFENVSFDFSRGRLTLKGFVNKESDAKSALQKASAVDGITFIDNQIRIQPSQA